MTSTDNSTRAVPRGIICPLATPLDGAGHVVVYSLAAHVDALAADVDGLFLLGSSGELPWLTDEVSEGIVADAVDVVGGRLPLSVGTGDTSTVRTLRRIERLAIDGVDGLVVAAPYYYPVEPGAGLVDYFAGIADRAPLPIVLYNIPQNTHNPLAPETVRILSEHDNIVGVKDSAGDMFDFLELVQHASESFSVLQGREQLMAVSYWAGASGVISSMANVAPRLLRKLADSLADPVAAMACQREVTRLGRLFDQGYWLSALKAALDCCGFDVGSPTPPLPPSTPAQRETIAALLDSADHDLITRRVA
jgi:4-hydroxy-tetrahydrodipicolinate synthase